MTISTLYVKRHLPEIIDAIGELKHTIRNLARLYETMVKACIKETVDENVDFGVITTEDMVESIYELYIKAKTMKAFLEKMVKKISTDEKNS